MIRLQFLRKGAAALVVAGALLLMITFPFAAEGPSHGTKTPLPGWAIATERASVGCFVLAACLGIVLRRVRKRSRAASTNPSSNAAQNT